MKVDRNIRVQGHVRFSWHVSWGQICSSYYQLVMDWLSGYDFVTEESHEVTTVEMHGNLTFVERQSEERDSQENKCASLNAALNSETKASNCPFLLSIVLYLSETSLDAFACLQSIHFSIFGSNCGTEIWTKPAAHSVYHSQHMDLTTMQHFNSCKIPWIQKTHRLSWSWTNIFLFQGNDRINKQFNWSKQIKCWSIHTQ